MTVAYKLLKTGGRIAHNKEFRVVLDEYGTVGLKRIGRRIERATSITFADIVGTLDALAYELAEQLKGGSRVHLPGLGYFSLAVKGDVYRDPKTQKVRLRNACVRTVKFRPERGLMNALRDTDFENVTYRSKPHDRPSEEQVEAALKGLFAESVCIFVSDIRSALYLSQPVAYRLVQKLESEGRLRNVGSPHHKVFVDGKV